MADHQILIDISRTLGRFDQRFDNQDESLLRIEARITALETRPSKRWSAIGKWIAGVGATFVAALALFWLGIRK